MLYIVFSKIAAIPLFLAKNLNFGPSLIPPDLSNFLLILLCDPLTPCKKIRKN